MKMIIFAFTMLSIVKASAVVTLGNAPNTNAPTGDRGWSKQGNWGRVLGTVVSSNYFLASKHAGGIVGDIFTFGGVGYRTIESTNYPNEYADLTLWKIAGSIASSNIATMYYSTNMVGLPITVFGRGAQRGEPVTNQIVNATSNSIPLEIKNFRHSSTTDEFDVFGGSLGIFFQIQKSTDLKTWTTLTETTYVVGTIYVVPRRSPSIHVSLATTTNSSMFYRVMTVTTNTILAGWMWGEIDGLMRWGTNVTVAVDTTNYVYDPGGLYIYSIFDRSGGADHSCITMNDSSGGAFTFIDGEWKLIGITHGVNYGPFSINGGASYFYATMFDLSGLWVYGGFRYPMNEGLIPALSEYAKIPVDWVRSITGQ